MNMQKKKSLLAAALPFVLCAEFLLVAGQATSLYATALAAPAPQDQTQDTPAVTTYTGKIMSQNGVRFILRDDSTDLWYHLDDQEQASKYLGKAVQVTGILDGRTDTIRVRNITETKS
jgi:uncharacterized protein DUF5818